MIWQKTAGNFCQKTHKNYIDILGINCYIEIDRSNAEGQLRGREFPTVTARLTLKNSCIKSKLQPD